MWLELVYCSNRFRRLFDSIVVGQIFLAIHDQGISEYRSFGRTLGL